MVLQNKTANKGRAANVRATGPFHISTRVGEPPAASPCDCLLATPDSRAENPDPVDQNDDLRWPDAAIDS